MSDAELRLALIREVQRLIEMFGVPDDTTVYDLYEKHYQWATGNLSIGEWRDIPGVATADISAVLNGGK